LSYRVPEPLGADHDLDQFECRSEEQTQWLRRYARLSVASATTRVFVVTPTDSNVVVAYYAWTMGQISREDAPPRLLKSGGRYPQPVALLARLGVDLNHEGKGLGAGLLSDVVQRSAAISDSIGCRGLLVHAESKEARSFYTHLIPEFEQSPTDELHLVLLIKDIKATIRRGIL